MNWNNHRVLSAALSCAIYSVARLLYATCRITWQHEERLEEARGLSPRGTVIHALWHDQVFACFMAHRHRGLVPMISKSGDGHLVACVSEWFGFRVVRGSSSQGGKEAMETMIEHIRQGADGALTIDGPRGPRRVVKAGVVRMSSQSEATILPTVSCCHSAWTLRSWDRLQIPRPFSRITLSYGVPISVARDATGAAFEKAMAKLSEALIDAERQGFERPS